MDNYTRERKSIFAFLGEGVFAKKHIPEQHWIRSKARINDMNGVVHLGACLHQILLSQAFFPSAQLQSMRVPTDSSTIGNFV